jgi:hypothetical protein
VRRGYIRWVFTDKGEASVPKRDNDAAKSFSIEEKQKIAAELLTAKRN